MITLYAGSGAGDFSVEGAPMPAGPARALKANMAKVLRARGNILAAEVLEKYPFQFVDGINGFGDEFTVLLATVPLGSYEALRKTGVEPTSRTEFAAIAKVAAELGVYVRFIATELDMNPPDGAETGSGLTRVEIQKVVNNYIGVEGGYLGDFSYRSHHEFYVDMELDINPYEYTGTTRERFIQIISESSSDVQARILEGVLARFPVGSSPLRTQSRADEISQLVRRLRACGPVATASPRVTTDVVERALADATNLLRTSGPVSAVDRAHTALHGWLKAACSEASISLSDDPGITEAMKAMREKHPKLQASGARSEEITRVLKALGAIVDSLNTIRNRASVAHANEQLLDEPEAMLVINTVQTLIHYLDSKLHA